MLAKRPTSCWLSRKEHLMQNLPASTLSVTDDGSEQALGEGIRTLPPDVDHLSFTSHFCAQNCFPGNLCLLRGFEGSPPIFVSLQNLSFVTLDLVSATIPAVGVNSVQHSPRRPNDRSPMLELPLGAQHGSTISHETLQLRKLGG